MWKLQLDTGKYKFGIAACTLILNIIFFPIIPLSQPFTWDTTTFCMFVSTDPHNPGRQCRLWQCQPGGSAEGCTHRGQTHYWSRWGDIVVVVSVRPPACCILNTVYCTDVVHLALACLYLTNELVFWKYLWCGYVGSVWPKRKTTLEIK